MAEEDLWIDDRNTASPEEIKKMEAAMTPEELREFEAKMKAIVERAYEELNNEQEI